MCFQNQKAVIVSLLLCGIIFFSHLFFNAVLQNIELCLDSFNAMTAMGFNNNLSNLFFLHNCFFWQWKSGKCWVISF